MTCVCLSVHRGVSQPTQRGGSGQSSRGGGSGQSSRGGSGQSSQGGLGQSSQGGGSGQSSQGGQVSSWGVRSVARGVRSVAGGSARGGSSKIGQQNEYSLHGGQYASCVHAGGLSCCCCDFTLLTNRNL